MEIGLFGGFGEAVPGADDLAVVAAEHAVADLVAQLDRDRAFQLDGQVGNAAPRIQYPFADEGFRGADVQAGVATAAVVACDRLVDGQGDIDEQLAEEEPAAGLAVEQQGVLADPAEPGLLRGGLLQHRRAVDEGAETEGADHLLNALGQLLDALADQLVIIAAQRIARDVGLLRLGQALVHACVAGQVVHAQGDHPQGAGYQLVGPRTLVAVGGHVVHLALVALLQPALQVGFVLGQVDAGDAYLLKAELTPPLLDGLGEGGGI